LTAGAANDGVILCFGEAIVDLVCEKRVDSLEEARAFRPHPGGALANVAVSAARRGARAALAGGVGDDAWGGWLAERLAAEGVDLTWFGRIPRLQTPVAFVTFGPDSEPDFSVHGTGIEAGVHATRDVMETAVGAAAALVLGSNTLVHPPERELTHRARELALARGTRVVFDPNLRPNRWAEPRHALELSRQMCERAWLVRANLGEARGITGLGESAGGAECADALCRLGTDVAVVTMGADGAVARGEVEAACAAPAVDVISPLGAGDALLGVLVAEAAVGGWGADAVGAALEAGVRAGADACSTWQAVP
jgi:sugar/nucleoside kinase (ribokinase family)